MGSAALNPQQARAVAHRDGPLVVFAGAGSGKTRVITHRVAHLVGDCGIQPHRILAVTFTNKAAGEMKERLAELLRYGAYDLSVGTFHSTCARLLRNYADRIGIKGDFSIYDDGDQKAMVTRVLRDMGLDDRRYQPKKVAGAINRAKRELVAPDDYEVEDSFTETIKRIYATYEERMRQAGALDFGDLIYQLVAAMERDRELAEEISGLYDHVLVDEFQDTNLVQSRLVQILCEKHRNLCVVGDDDQSIYRWRGADRRNILDFRRFFPEAEVVKLEQNYRSTKRILRVANSVITRNYDREPKELWTDNEEGPKVVVVRCEDERDEARMMVHGVRELVNEGRSLSDIVIFYRTHAQSRVFEEALRSHDVPYRVIGGMRFYDRAEIKDLLSYLRALNNPYDDVALLRIINTPTRGIGKTSIERLLDAAAIAGTGVWQVIQNIEQSPEFKTGARKKIGAFRSLMQGLQKRVDDGEQLDDLVQAILDNTGYIANLQDDDTPEADARVENVREFAGSVSEFVAEAEEPTLAAFLELVTLQTNVDNMDAAESLTLMTVHAAKGLEFPVVMVGGLEEQMFPLGADEDPEEMEEERRLAYVAFTRAEHRLVLSWASVRRIFGQMRVNQPSRFLREIPVEDTEQVGMSAPPPTRASWDRPGPGYGRSTGYGQRGQRSFDYDGGHDDGAFDEFVQPESGLGPQQFREPQYEGEYLDYADGESDGIVRIGMRVRHAKFGVGNVREVGEGIPPKVRVEFPGWGTKQIISTYLEPA